MTTGTPRQLPYATTRNGNRVVFWSAEQRAQWIAEAKRLYRPGAATQIDLAYAAQHVLPAEWRRSTNSSPFRIEFARDFGKGKFGKRTTDPRVIAILRALGDGKSTAPAPGAHRGNGAGGSAVTVEHIPLDALAALMPTTERTPKRTYSKRAPIATPAGSTIADRIAGAINAGERAQAFDILRGVVQCVHDLITK
jgi:hypothetical protein